jgi:hypothetical protein
VTEQTDPQPTGRAMTMREIREALGHNVTDPAKATDQETLRERIVEALLTTRRADYADLGVRANHRVHRFDARCALCTYDVDALADAVLAVLPATDQRAGGRRRAGGVAAAFLRAVGRR